MAVSKDHLNKLIQQLPEEALPIAADFLEKLVTNKEYRHIPWMMSQLLKMILKQLKKAKESFRRGESIKLKDVIDDLLN